MKLTVLPVGALGANCYILEDGSDCVVVDPGAQADKILAKLKELGLSPSHILLTHGHADHTGAVAALKAQHPACSVLIGAQDADLVGPDGGSMMRSYKTEVAIDRFVSEGDVIKAGALELTVIETPGHSKGSVVYRCGDLLFTGDTLFAGDCGRTDLYGGSWPVMQATLRKLRELEGDFKVLPGHGPDSTLETERKHNQYMRDA